MVALSNKTIHLNSKWYDKKRPNLQFDILSCLILRGPLSKGQAEAILNKGHSDILKSFDILENKGLIKKGKARIFGRGRRQYKYEITLKGVEGLIIDKTTTPLNFWKIMYGFCHYYNNKNDTDQVDRFFELFFNKYLLYSNRNPLDLTDIFNNMSKLWFEELQENSNKINPEQNILEVLAVNPPLTVSELKEKTKLDIVTINKILHNHTVEFFNSIIRPAAKVNKFSNITPKNKNKLYALFFRHNLIKVKNDESNEVNYELSLFGVILVIKLIRCYNIKNKENYYFNHFSFVDYLNKIANNYKEKIPLIFGEWNILNEILKSYAIYNFDLIIEADDIFKENQISLSLGGSKELYYGIKEIILQTHEQIGEFVNQGGICEQRYFSDDIPEYDEKIQNDCYLSKNFLTKQGQEGYTKMSLYLQLKRRILLRDVNPLELSNFYKENFEELGIPEDKFEKYEELFAEEISVLYYFNLYNDTLPNKNYYYPSPFDNKINDGQQMLNIIPKKCLSQILKEDNDITDFYLKWKNDIIILNEKIFEIIQKWL